MMKLQALSLCALIAGSSAFSPVRTFSHDGCQKSSSLSLPIGECRAPRSTALRIATSPEDLNTGVITPTDDLKHPEMMDEDIYRFNKLLIDTVYNVICFFYPVEGTKRDFARFYVLETVARIPYFAYLSVLHLRETFGERGLSDKMLTHYAETDNELHHLLIMESLGGNENVIDRILAQTMAFFYYWYVAAIYFFSPPVAYHLSELIEDHAYETYDAYLRNHGDMLKEKEVPAVAAKYYMEDNSFLFDLLSTAKDKDDDGNFNARRPKLNNLYDVFVSVRDDEKEHWKTLCNLVQYGDMKGAENSTVQSTKALRKGKMEDDDKIAYTY